MVEIIKKLINYEQINTELVQVTCKKLELWLNVKSCIVVSVDSNTKAPSAEVNRNCEVWGPMG